MHLSGNRNASAQGAFLYQKDACNQKSMEGPSIHLAVQHHKPFIRKRVLALSGNSTLDQTRMKNLVVRDIFAWGKHLVIQFDGFALKTHFLMFGTYEADVYEHTVTGDYKRARVPRLAFTFTNGELRLFACSVKFIEARNARTVYDPSIMSRSSSLCCVALNRRTGMVTSPKPMVPFQRGRMTGQAFRFSPGSTGCTGCTCPS